MKNKTVAAFCCLALIMFSGAAVAELNAASLANAQHGETVVFLARMNRTMTDPTDRSR